MLYSFSENEWGEKYIEELNRSDFANVKYSEFFHKAFDYDLESDNTLYVIIGSDSGLILPYLNKQNVGRGSRFVVIEHDSAYRLISKEYRGLLTAFDKTETDTSKTISLHRASSWREEVFDGTDRAWLLGGKIRLIESNASVSDYSRLYMPIFQSVKGAIEDRVLEISGSMNRRVFTQMQFANAADSVTALSSSDDFGKGRTAIVLGASPSLDLHLDWVIANREKLFILAVSRLAGKLIKLNLKPDVMVSVDPFDFSYEVSKQAIIWTDVPLLYSYHVSHKLLQQWQGPSFFLGKRLPWHTEKELKGKAEIAGPTVSHAAVYAASQLGFSQILMTGVDLCYSNSTLTHTSDSPERMIQQMPSLCNAQLETYSGRIAGTNMTLKQGVSSLEELGKLINHEKPILVNLSEEAAFCNYIPYKSADDILLPEARPDFSTHMNTERDHVSVLELDELYSELKLARYKFIKIQKLCTKAKSCIKKMHSNDVELNARKYSTSLKKIRKELENDFSEYLLAITYDNAIDFDKTNLPTDFHDMTKEELIQWGCQYYDLVDQGAEDMITLIDDSYTRIQLRRDELDENVNVRDLAARWRSYGTPGRILLWKRHNWHRVEPKDRAWVQRAVGKFRSTLNETASSTKKRLSKSNSDIDNVLKSLVFLSQNRKHEELFSIYSNLDNSDWPYSVLKEFTAGLVLELEENVPAAIGQFQLAIDLCSQQLETNNKMLNSTTRLLEECLVRMTEGFISQGDNHSALTSLGMLCEILPSYVVTYAKTLDSCGHKQFAIELLTTFVELYPAHKRAQMHLDELLREMHSVSPDSNNPVYVKKINGAVKAILGDNSGQAA